jgi:guanine nucleotide-binding protein subunit alpha
MGSCTSKDIDSSSGGGNSGGGNKRKEQQAALNSSSKGTSGGATTSNGKQLTSNSNSDSSAVSQEKPAEVESSSKSGQKEVKVLLLGPGESGKSTIVKQMKILHENGYSEEELLEYKPFVYKNVLDCIKNVIHAIIDLQPDLINKDHTTVVEENENSVEEFDGDPFNRKHILNYDDLNDILDYEIAIDSDEPFNPAIASKINTVYKYPEVKTFIKLNQGKFYLIDSTHYLLSQITRIAEPNYIPSVSDVLRTRKKTSGIFDFKFQMGNGLNIHMFDVGGQRSERRKWIHCFDNVTLIIFCVALSEYDQVLLEENTQNRLEESLTLFDSVVNSRWFARTSVVLFLNKIDVFAEKLPYSPLEKHFPDYTGGNNINKAAKYILWRFTQVNRSGLNIYPHVTQATDTSNIQLVFAAVKETILENSLRDSGLL